MLKDKLIHFIFLLSIIIYFVSPITYNLSYNYFCGSLHIALLVLFYSIKESDNYFDFDTLFQNGSIIVISALNQQFQPIFTLRAFLQCDLQFCNEIRLPVGIKRFANVCTNACAGSNQLVGQNRFLPG